MYMAFAFAFNVNLPLSGWNVSNVTNMGYMFQDASKVQSTVGSFECTFRLILGVESHHYGGTLVLFDLRSQRVKRRHKIGPGSVAMKSIQMTPREHPIQHKEDLHL